MKLFFSICLFLFPGQKQYAQSTSQTEPAFIRDSLDRGILLSGIPA
jgi:hypothetical protein